MGAVIAVDIGGTHLRAALFEADDPQPVAQERAPTNAHEPGAYDRLHAVIRSVWPDREGVTAIGAAAPGPVDPRSGVIFTTPNIPEWRDFPLGARLAADFGVPTFVNNDANAAALGEWRYGAARGHHDVLYMTISTGIGGGVIIDDRLLQGFHGLAAELGHVIIDPDGPLCSCGFAGHVESFASGPAIVKYVQSELERGAASRMQRGDPLTARSIAEAAMGGDELAVSAYQRAGRYLGIAVANFLATLNPSIVVFGGGVSTVGDLLFDPFRESLKQHVFHPHYLEDLKIEMAVHGDDAGLLGALALAQSSTPVQQGV